MSNLFDGFNPTNTEDWKTQIKTELKGLDYNETLVYKTLEGITIEPFYTKENIDYANLNPVPRSNKGWDIFTSKTDDIDSQEVDGVLVNPLTKLNDNGLKKWVKINALNEIDQVSPNKNTFLKFDIYGNLVETGNWFSSKELDEEKVTNTFSIEINNSIYQNAGANITEQIALALVTAQQYIDKFGSDIVNKLHFNFAMGNHYFLEISKIRAFRFLWETLTKDQNIENEAFIFCESSQRNKSILDSYSNVIRSTFEASSAILGTADAVLINNYDSLFNSSNEFSEELAHKQQLILKKESYLDKFSDPAHGAYFIEELTNQLAEKALSLFKYIQEEGGLLNSLKNGYIQKIVNKSAAKEQQWFDEGKINLIGINKFRNESEDVPSLIANNTSSSENEIMPLSPKRLAETIELSI